MKKLSIGSVLISLICILLSIPSTSTCQKLEKSQVDSLFRGPQFRNIGPFRGGRSVAATGVISDPMTYYMGTCGGGVWKTDDAGITWHNISDGFFKTGSVGAIEVADSDPNVIYVGMGEHAIRGVMTSHGDGVYRSTDAGKTWKHLGLPKSRHISEIQIHPTDPDIVYVGVQGAAYGESTDRGLYMTTDGGATWDKVLYIDGTTGISDLSMDHHNPRILYASTWDHRRYPWQVRSGGPGSAFYKSTDGGVHWDKLEGGLPKHVGKTSIDVSQANSEVVYVNVEAEGEKAGVYRSDDAGKTWKQTSKDRVTVARAWYYIEIFADPQNENVVYVLNAPMLKSIDGGKTFKPISNPHGDQHHMWVNPKNPSNIILANDGGSCITFNGGSTWSSQQNQPTAQFYRVITDNRFPYYVYGGQQDNSTVAIASRNNRSGIGVKDWYAVAGGESAFLAFDDNDPSTIYGGSYQGNISVYDKKTSTTKDIMAHPVAGLGWHPRDMKYRFNWNAPIVASPQDPSVIFHASNKVLKTTDGGMSWIEISDDLTRNDTSKHVIGGAPYTNEGAGGEVYNTISYMTCSTHDAKVLWVGSDCGLVHVTTDGGESWQDVSPRGLGETLINSIEVSPHDAGTAYIVSTKYKFNDFSPAIHVTNNYGKSWRKITNGIAQEDWVRAVREDKSVAGLLFAGTEGGLYTSQNGGISWTKTQYGLPLCPISDITLRNNDLIVATLGRAFWILDDLSPIQQSTEILTMSELSLVQPKTSYRFLSRDSRGDNSGANPYSGVIIDYFVPQGYDSLTLNLEIRDAEDNLVRTYSSEKDESFKKYQGGPQAEKRLSKEHGMNRINWDLRRGILPGVEKVFSLGSYSGSYVAPGQYTLTLSDGERQKTQTVEILADPRTSIPQQDYDQQVETLIKLENTVRDIYESVNDLRKVKGRIELIDNQLQDIEGTDSLSSQTEKILAKIMNWEEELIQSKQKTFQDVINFPNQLSAEIMNLISRINGNDPRMTQGAQKRSDQLIGEWSELKKEMSAIITEDIAAFNDAYQAQQIPILVVPKVEKKIIKP